MSTHGMTTPAINEAALGVDRSPGPLPDTWRVRLTCDHGATTGYLVARRLVLPAEGAAVLRLIVDRHRRERPPCRCVPSQPMRWAS